MEISIYPNSILLLVYSKISHYYLIIFPFYHHKILTSSKSPTFSWFPYPSASSMVINPPFSQVFLGWIPLLLVVQQQPPPPPPRRRRPARSTPTPVTRSPLSPALGRRRRPRAALCQDHSAVGPWSWPSARIQRKSHGNHGGNPENQWPWLRNPRNLNWRYLP